MPVEQPAHACYAMRARHSTAPGVIEDQQPAESSALLSGRGPAARAPVPRLHRAVRQQAFGDRPEEPLHCRCAQVGCLPAEAMVAPINPSHRQVGASTQPCTVLQRNVIMMLRPGHSEHRQPTCAVVEATEPRCDNASRRWRWSRRGRWHRRWSRGLILKPATGRQRG